MINLNDKVAKVFKRNIKKYIDNNLHLYCTDDAYTVLCHLEPRIISGAVEKACSECKNMGLLESCDVQCLKNLSASGNIYAVQYINEKTKQLTGRGRKCVVENMSV